MSTRTFTTTWRSDRAKAAGPWHDAEREGSGVTTGIRQDQLGIGGVTLNLKGAAAVSIIESRRNVMSTESLVSLFRIRTDNPGLMQSQVKALSTRIPLLYFIVFVNTAAVAWTHYGVAPDSVTVGFPTIVLIGSLMRGRAWMKSRGQAISNAEAGGLLKSTVVVGGVFGVVFLVWGLALYQYGDAYAQGHVVFYMAVTVISGIFCLMHLRSAALLLTGVTVIPFAIFFLATGQPIFVAIAVNMLLVSVAMVYSVLTYSRDFANMIAFQEELVETHNSSSTVGALMRVISR